MQTFFQSLSMAQSHQMSLGVLARMSTLGSSEFPASVRAIREQMADRFRFILKKQSVNRPASSGKHSSLRSACASRSQLSRRAGTATQELQGASLDGDPVEVLREHIYYDADAILVFVSPWASVKIGISTL